jgi:endonuclease/exonuclease/phosphatase family metal-dependent hydrolase
VTAVATWNVLHRVHAENWRDDVAAHWPDERARIAAVTARLAGRTEQVIALQEVSGDQLASLHGLAGRTVYSFRYPRVPRPRRGPDPLRDRAEYLVLLLDGPGRQAAAWSFAGDPGKGGLAVEAGGMLFVSVHVGWGDRRTAELARLAALAASWPAYPVVLLGDFNADRATVAAGLGDGFEVAAPAPGGLPTRPGPAGGERLFIDHLAVRGARAAGVTVEDAGGLSDHNLVRAHVSGRFCS